MKEKTLRYIFYVLVLIGFADSMYLSMTVLLGIAPACGILHGCETVAASPYSRLLGIPLAYIGTAFYAVGAVLAGYLLESALSRKLALAYSVAGALMSAWFVYIQAEIIGAFCIYCVISAVVTFGLLAISIPLSRKEVTK